MFPVLLYVYRRLAAREERDVRAEFGSVYDRYAVRVPRFIPHLHQASAQTPAPLGGTR
jgi:protein-S-isoprenylcysteine O-methyltransferase Ste14